MAQPTRRRRAPEPSSAPRVRRGALKIAHDVAWRVRAGHPLVYRDALGGRPLREAPGDEVELLDPSGAFVGRGLYDTDGPIAVRVFSRTAGERLTAETVRGRIAHARALRERLLAPLEAMRVVHGEGDGLPGLSVDRYGEFLVLQLFSAALEPHLPAIADGLEAVWRPRAIYLQQRFRPQSGQGPREPARLLRGEAAPVEVAVREGELTFGVDVTAPLGTGLFLDLRDGRRAVARYAAGRRVLNLFSYTGAFSLHAAKAGAREVVSVDLSPRAHARARRNLQLSGSGEQGHEFVAGDAAKVIARMADRGRRFDLVVVDPPSFAQAKGHVFVAQKDYRDLVTEALSVTEPGGLLACASNTAKLQPDDFDRILGDGAGRAHRPLVVVERCGLPADFPVPAGYPEGHYLKFSICSAD